MFNKKNSNKSGPAVREPKEYEEAVIQIDRVTKVVKGGRRLRFRATVVIGNKKGRIGIGIGKSNEVTGSIQKAIAKAKKGLINVCLNGTTIPHEIYVKYKSAKLLLLPACPGTGIIAGGPVRKILDLAGIKDILSKCLGTSNKVNNTKAAIDALKKLKPTPFMKKAKPLKIALEKTEKVQKETPKEKPQKQPQKPSKPLANEKTQEKPLPLKDTK